MDTDDKSDVPVFQFKNESLKDRCKDVFGCLDELEQKHKVFEKSRAVEDAESDRDLIRQGPSVEDPDCVAKDSTSSTFKHTGSGQDYHSNRQGSTLHGNDKSRYDGDFKIPNRPPRGRGQFRGRPWRGRSVPDYKSHPERWTEYSLDNVDLSNSSMKQAAFSFLQERKQMREDAQREEGVNIESVACSKGLISFKKPVRNKNADEKDKDTEKKKTVNANQKIAMDEEDREEIDNIDDDNDDDEIDSNVVSKGESVRENVVKSDSSNQSGEKRKRDLLDIDVDKSVESSESGEGKSDENKNTGFKSRKISRKNIRSRREKNDSDSD